MAEESSLYHPVTITMTGTAPSFYVTRAIDEVQQKLPDLSIDIKFKHEPDALEAQVSGRLSIQYKIPNHLNNTIEFARRLETGPLAGGFFLRIRKLRKPLGGQGGAGAFGSP